ncbi:hypothetical protein BDN72DRAFT_840074 [Pluteus cervinus]|uniref:Uncharacterized protein n=1 Tax=Pluteus cervinus TaxID=181527 RepID=A0ACD3AVU5_9AGAR|nr:hypothetical protein BDN72DRAFT_840074 [Pluteus cervinus]
MDNHVAVPIALRPGRPTVQKQPSLSPPLLPPSPKHKRGESDSSTAPLIEMTPLVQPPDYVESNVCRCECHPSCPNCPRSVSHRIQFHAKTALLKSLWIPLFCIFPILLGQVILQLVSQKLKLEYGANMLWSVASAFAGGACLLGVAIFGIFLMDMNLGRKRGWRRSITLSATFVACCISVMAAPLGVLLVNINRLPNEKFLDLYHALVASGIGASIIFSIRLLFKVISVARRIHLRRRQRQKQSSGRGIQPYVFAYDPAVAYNDDDDEICDCGNSWWCSCDDNGCCNMTIESCSCLCQTLQACTECCDACCQCLRCLECLGACNC